MIAIHAGGLAGVWLLGWDRPVNLARLALFGVIEIGRYWVLWSLGRVWSTRIIVLSGAPMVASGPYRLFKHPN